MPTFILHGGDTISDVPTNRAFFKEMAERVPQGGLWLGCYFASTAEREGPKYLLDESKVRAAATHDFATEKAVAENFLEQLARADVVYFAGGKTAGLMRQMAGWPNIAEHIAKVPTVVGSSAGMNMLGRNYISKNANVGHGLGLVPFNMIVHQGAPEYANAINAANHKPPILALQETQFCILTL